MNISSLRHVLHAYYMHRLTIVVVCISMIGISIPLFFNIPFFCQYAQGSFDYGYELSYLDNSLSNGAYDTAPEELRRLVSEKREALQRMSDASTPRNYYAAVADMLFVRIQEGRAGYLTDSNRGFDEAHAEFYRLLASLDNPEVFAGSSSMPTLQYAVYIIAQYPVFVWYLPAVTALWISSTLFSRKRLLGRTPLTATKSWTIRWLSSVVLALTLVVCSFIVPLAVAFFKNGLGDPAYPVMYRLVDGYAFKTVGDLAVEYASLICLGHVFIVSIGMLAEGLFNCSGSWLKGLPALLGACIAFVPAVQGFMGGGTAVSNLRAFMPTTYLAPYRVVGEYTCNFPGLSEAIPGASLIAGCAILVLFSLACVGISLMVTMIRGRASMGSRKGAHYA